MTVEKLFSHVAVDTPIVKAAAYNEYMFGKASLNCSISFVTVSKVECEAVSSGERQRPHSILPPASLTAAAEDQLEASQLLVA